MHGETPLLKSRSKMSAACESAQNGLTVREFCPSRDQAVCQLCQLRARERRLGDDQRALRCAALRE
jgi:hypothetical protein